MPIYLRNFYVNKLAAAKKEEREAMDKSSKGSSPNSKPDMHQPPTFTK